MKAIVTGIAGFIGVHTADALARCGHEVAGFDNLSRLGAQENLAWLLSRSPDVKFQQLDLREAQRVRDFAYEHADADLVIHLAGQVAVTTSVADPVTDFDINARGTLNVLEAVRFACPDATLIFASTNKVYGRLERVQVELRGQRYAYSDRPLGISEDEPLDFHSPYGCSKGAADQYVHDYARIFGLRTVTLRQSCIYGTRQFGVEDQGWVAWFTIAASLGLPIIVYGDGRQVRDILWIDDLVDLYLAIAREPNRVSGRALNIGGGVENIFSLLELVECLSSLTGKEIRPEFREWRPGDQRIFVADTSAVTTALGWQPQVRPSEGVERLHDWVLANEQLLREYFSDASV